MRNTGSLKGWGEVQVGCLMLRELEPVSRFGPEKAIFSSSVFKDRQVYTPETSCTEWNLCLHKEYVNKTALQ